MTDWANATEDDLLALVTSGEVESHYLDFKQKDALVARTDADKKRRCEELAKDVSAFAHADGGTLIYGVVEAGNPVCAQALKGFKGNAMTKETVAQLVQASPEPGVTGVKIREVQLKSQNPASDPGSTVFVVCVPQADTVHQETNCLMFSIVPEGPN